MVNLSFMHFAQIIFYKVFIIFGEHMRQARSKNLKYDRKKYMFPTLMIQLVHICLTAILFYDHQHLIESNWLGHQVSCQKIVVG